jgi:hypothetical protein
MSQEINESAEIHMTAADGSKQTVTLGDLLGIDMDEVTEKRFSAFPKGNFNWEVEALDIGVIGEGDKAKAGITAKFKCLEVLNVSDPEFTEDQNTLVNKSHQEAFFITNMDSFGYFKAFMKDIGAPYDKNIKTMCEKGVGTRFFAPIQKRKDKDDTDKVYTSLNRGKLKPLGAAPVSGVAAAVAA